MASKKTGSFTATTAVTAICRGTWYVFRGRHLLVNYLHPSEIDPARHAWAILSLLVKVRQFPLPVEKQCLQVLSGCPWMFSIRWDRFGPLFSLTQLRFGCVGPRGFVRTKVCPVRMQWHSFSEFFHSVKDSVLGLGYPLIFYSVSPDFS